MTHSRHEANLGPRYGSDRLEVDSGQFRSAQRTCRSLGGKLKVRQSDPDISPVADGHSLMGRKAMLCVRRREFIALVGGAAAWPLAASAQQSRRVPRIGVLLLGTPASFAGRIEAFVEGLRDLGYVDGRTVAIEWKWGQDRVDQLPDLAAELVRSQVDVIVTGGTPAAQTLKNATRTIPIVMAIVGDPVAAGLVDSLARPGGNATGFSIVATDLSGRRLQLLKEMVPGLSSIAVMSNATNPQSQTELRETQSAARSLEASFGADFR